jgi:hypothetical protein
MRIGERNLKITPGIGIWNDYLPEKAGMMVYIES